MVQLNRGQVRQTSGRCEDREGEPEQDGALDRQNQWKVTWRTLIKWYVETKAETGVGRDKGLPASTLPNAFLCFSSLKLLGYCGRVVMASRLGHMTNP